MKLFSLITLSLVGFSALAQTAAEDQKTMQVQTLEAQPFLYQVNALTSENKVWILNYSGGYGNNVITPFGFNGLDQHLAIKGYLGSGFTLLADAGFGFSKSAIRSAQQVEVLKGLIGKNRLQIAAGLGAIREWSNSKAIFSRFIAGYNTQKWKLAGNMRFEKSFESQRDKIDLLSSVGVQHQFSKSLFVGFEAAGEDLEGLWDKEEAEGGAKLFIGPSLSLLPAKTNLVFSLSAGPVLYANQGQPVMNTALRNFGLPTSNGYTVKFQISRQIGNTNRSKD
jgi:hypothetical protein